MRHACTLLRKTTIDALCSMYASSMLMSVRSSTSRKTRMPGSRCLSCRLITAHLYGKTHAVLYVGLPL